MGAVTPPDAPELVPFDELEPPEPLVESPAEDEVSPSPPELELSPSLLDVLLPSLLDELDESLPESSPAEELAVPPEPEPPEPESAPSPKDDSALPPQAPRLDKTSANEVIPKCLSVAPVIVSTSSANALVPGPGQ